MEIAKDFQEYLDKNLESIAESHIEAWKERYIGYTIQRLESDLDINHDDSLEIESAEYALKRDQTDDEEEYLREVFHKEVVHQFFGLPDDYENADDLKKENERLKAELEEIKKNENWTGLYDTRGNKIFIGNVVHWTDGGDDLSLEERIKTRWDRIAVVDKEGIEVVFKVFDSPSEHVRMREPYFCYGNFIYKETEKYLTIVAENKNEYRKKFKDAGECMKYVLEGRNVRV